MKQVVFYPVAVADLEEIVQYLAQDNNVAAAHVREDIFGTASSIGLQPDLGVRPDSERRVSKASAFSRHGNIRFTCCFTANSPMRSKVYAFYTARETCRRCLSRETASGLCATNDQATGRTRWGDGEADT
jgi:plasmid stabilization system protein ParE